MSEKGILGFCCSIRRARGAARTGLKYQYVLPARSVPLGGGETGRFSEDILFGEWRELTGKPPFSPGEFQGFPSYP